MRLLSLCFFSACSFASYSAELYPGAPAAASDYAFLIGHWQCQYEQLDPQGKVLFSAHAAGKLNTPLIIRWWWTTSACSMRKAK
ncbi:hypothetical protein [Pseudoalteromonas sp. PPB1]|uniref:hypothetical protein n=1 Tax=Pseudoalteromonas sp. PPB1 TaxID=2756136 RepID=UPI001891DF75|nr:hypothetical protein [Pseudoalteromonas sp. PPB1]